VARRLRRLSLLENSCQHRSEDFVPPAAQRYAVRRTAPDLAVVRGNTNRHTTIGVYNASQFRSGNSESPL